MNLRLPLLSLALLASLAVGCGGGTSSAVTPPAPATGLSYVDPSGSGWRLVKDPSSTDSRLVLALVGPAGTLSRGVGFNLQAPEALAFERFADGGLLEDAGQYDLLSAANDPTEPVARVGGVKPGHVLSVGIYQKDRAKAAKDSGAPLCRIALSLVQPTQRPAGATLDVRVLKAKIIPADIGAITDDPFTLDQKLRMAPITVAVGTLTTR